VRARRVEEDAGIGGVVLDDEEDAVPGDDLRAVVGRLARADRLRGGRRGLGGRGLLPLDRDRHAVAAVGRLPARRVLRQEGLRQEEPERAALARPALARELTAERARGLWRDGEPR